MSLLEAAPTPTPTPSPAPTPGGEAFNWTRDEAGTFSDGFLDRIPADLAEAKPTIAKYRSLPDVFKALHHANQMLGKKANAITVPGENAAPEEIAAYRKALGIPEKPEDYKLGPEKAVDGSPWTAERAAKYAKLAHENGVTPAAMRKIVESIIGDDTASIEAHNSRIAQEEQEGEKALRKHFGQNYEKRMDQARRVAQTAHWKVEDSKLLSDPDGVIALAGIFDMISEDKWVGGDINATLHPGKTEAERIIRDPTHPMHQRYMDGDPEVNAHVQRLFTNG